MGIAYNHFIPTKIPLDFYKKMCMAYNVYIFDILSQEITLSRGCYDLNLNPISQTERWGSFLKGGNMSNRQYIFMLIMALIGGVIGGTLSSKVFVDTQVFAQDKNKKKIIEAEEFHLVDKSNRIWAKLTAEDPLFAKMGGTIISGAYFVIYGAQVDESGVIKRDKDGKAFPDSKTKITLNTCIYPIISVTDSKYDSFTSLSASPTKPYLRMGMKQIGYVNLDGGINPSLTFAEEDNWIRTYLGYDGLEFSDEKHLTHAVLGSTELKNTRTGSIEKRPISSLVLFNDDGKVIWSSP
jgi:hypothetical protein